MPSSSQRRRSDSIVEVIDVDSLDDTVLQRPLQRRRTRSPELISLVDSDDEVALPSRRRQSGSGGSRRVDRNRLFSPPPPAQSRSIPPLPPFPAQFSPHRSYPMRRRPPPFPSPSRIIASGVVRPSTQPLPIEELMAASSSTGPSAGPSAAPRRAAEPRRSDSRHSLGGTPPAMRLGGALITTNRSREAELRQDRERRALQRSSGSVNRRRPVQRAPEMRRQGGLTHLLAFNDADEMLAMQLFMHGDHPPIFLNRGLRWKEEEVDYRKSYTHPAGPEPGFTFDFASSASPESAAPSPFPSTSQSNPIIIDDDAGANIVKSSSTTAEVNASPSASLKLSTLLVCANCKDPLLLGSANTDEEARRLKIWGLRCGHLIDGKCLNRLSIPIPVLGEEDTTGKSKGKGKAKAVEPEDDYHDELTSADLFGTSPIRSRLRSSSHQGQGGSDNLSMFHQLTSAVPSFLKRKRKTKEKVEQEFKWACPVEDCGKMHTSVKMNGEWGAEKARGEGAIGVFV